jgi:ferritin-like metal-binding protein YciE
MVSFKTKALILREGRALQNYDNFWSAMKMEDLKSVYIEQLKDLYNAETQLVKALPKMARASSSEQLQAGFEGHMDETKGHVERLERIFEMLKESPKGKRCIGMEALVKEGDEIIGERVADGVRDAALIAAAQRVEHYEVAAYGTLRSYAELLGEKEHASLLAETLQEEEEAEHMLTDVAQNISFQAPGTSKEKSEEIMEHTGPGVKQTPNQAA